MQLYVLHLLLVYIILWLASSCTSHPFTSYYLDEFKSSILVLNFNISLSHTSRLSISLCQHRITCHLLGCHAFLLKLTCVWFWVCLVCGIRLWSDLELSADLPHYLISSSYEVRDLDVSSSVPGRSECRWYHFRFQSGLSNNWVEYHVIITHQPSIFDLNLTLHYSQSYSVHI